jgi:hypothetical protein
MEKTRLVDFVAKVMEESGFKVYKNFQTSRHIIDIYGVLPSVLGDVGVVVAVKNYDERWEVGLDVLKEMEMVAKTLKASKIVVVSSSYFTDNAINYAGRRNIKLIDKDGLVNMAKKFSKREYVDDDVADDDTDLDVADEEYTPTKKSTGLSFFSGPRKSLSKGGKSRPASSSIGPALSKVLSNTIVLIILVILISTFVKYLVSVSGDENTAFVGIATILSSAILSYGLVLFFERNLMSMLVKGTTVFFVSLIVQVIIILAF